LPKEHASARKNRKNTGGFTMLAFAGMKPGH